MFEFLIRAHEAGSAAPAGKHSVRDIMTWPVATVAPDTPVRAIARLLAEKGISAVPVVDGAGAPVGVVSDGDLIGRAEEDRVARRSWWLLIIAEGHPLTEDAVAGLAPPERSARDVMTTPVITISPDNDVEEVARLFAAQRIKRAPVVEDGRIVGLVSRADLLQALFRDPAAPPPEPSSGPGAARTDAPAPRPQPEPLPCNPGREAASEAEDTEDLSAQNFRSLVKRFDSLSDRRREAERQAAAERRRAAIKELTDHHLADDTWAATLHRAREAAACGAREMLMLRFPHDLCSDGGRAINAPEPDWPATLRGEAAEAYLRWERELKPQGFHIAARVLDFPDGLLGDIGLFMLWGK